jgi:hypothetical protein
MLLLSGLLAVIAKCKKLQALKILEDHTDISAGLCSNRFFEYFNNCTDKEAIKMADSSLPKAHRKSLLINHRDSRCLPFDPQEAKQMECLFAEAGGLDDVDLRASHHVFNGVLEAIGRNSPEIQYFRLADCPAVDATALQAFLSRYLHLSSISLISCGHLSDSDLLHIFCTSREDCEINSVLDTIAISGHSTLTTATVIRMVESNVGLKSIHLGGCSLVDIKALCSHFKGSGRVVNVSDKYHY